MQRKSLLPVLTLVALALLGAVCSVSLAAAPPNPQCVVTNLRAIHHHAHPSYATLKEAVEVATARDTLQVQGTCYGDTTITKDLTIIAQSNPAFGPATLDGMNTAANLGSVLTIDNAVNVAITGLIITGGETPLGGGIFNAGGLTLKDSTVTANTAQAEPRPGSLTLASSTITANTAEVEPSPSIEMERQESAGGGIYNDQGSLTLEDSTVTANRTLGVVEPQVGSLGGGGIYNEEGSLRLRNSTVSGNEAKSAGGGIKNSGGQVWITDSILSTNTAERAGFHGVGCSRGAGIDSAGGQVRLINSTVALNASVGGECGGGGIGNTEASTMIVNNTTVTENKSTGEGGGIYNEEGSLTLNNSSVSDNEAKGGQPNGRGGGIGNVGGASLTLNNSTVSGNSTGLSGGGVANLESSFTLNSTTVTENKSTDEGGGIYNWRGSVMHINDSTVSGNTTEAAPRSRPHGGGIYNEGSLALDDSTVSRNTAENGGGIFNEDLLELSGSSSVRRNQASKDGGGIYNLAGSVTFNDSASVTRNEASIPGSGGGIFNNKTGGATVVFEVGWTGMVSHNEPENIEEL